jgi:hypothetical protein
VGKEMVIKFYPGGAVETEVKGIIGPGCTKATDIVKNILGSVEVEEKKTAEYYKKVQEKARF